jgi:hypothetical protein
MPAAATRCALASPHRTQAEILVRHRAIAAEAWRIELVTPRAMLETYKVLRVGAREIAQHRDGLYVLDPMVVLLNRVGLFDRSEGASGRRLRHHQPDQGFRQEA